MNVEFPSLRRAERSVWADAKCGLHLETTNQKSGHMKSLTADKCREKTDGQESFCFQSEFLRVGE